MTRWTTTTLVVAMALLLALPAAAQERDGRWALGLEGGVWKQIGGDHDYGNLDQVTGLRLLRGVGPRWTLDLGLTYGWTRPGVGVRGEDAGWSFDTGAGLYTRIWQPSLSGRYHLTEGGTWRPWVSLGAGVTRWDVRDLRGEDSIGLWPDGDGVRVRDEDGDLVDGHGVDVTAILGLGTELAAGDHWSFDLAVRYHWLLGQDTDSVGLSSFWGPEHVDANTGILQGVVGVRYRFGDSDRDGDGIPNGRDADPDAPEDFDGYRDDDGAPDPDNDGDGIADTADGAPDDAEDRDGFQDADGVPDPDNDGDGIPDVRDGAPDQAEDIDGFEDTDGVPDPDNDGDGVPDTDDRCPGTPAGVEVDAEGCPVVEEIREDLVLEGVTFKLGSAELTADSADQLDRVAASLAAWPEVRVEVAGYTDSSGPQELNRRLSQERAESVRSYLVARGIDPERIVATGYGEQDPVASNETAAGRAMNRRVELKRID
jgi:outer membrane protein OmpA-like peptidoglycan-associated protein/opacity protein-like surface antigen